MLESLQRLQSFSEHQDPLETSRFTLRRRPSLSVAARRKVLILSEDGTESEQTAWLTDGGSGNGGEGGSVVFATLDDHESGELDGDERAAAPGRGPNTFLWWLGIILSVLLPQALAYWARVHESISDLSGYCREVAAFSESHPIYVPSLGEDEARYSRTVPVTEYRSTDASLIAWQSDLDELYRRVLALKVLDQVSETSLEFAVSGAHEFEPRRDLPLTAYFVLSLLVYFTDNLHLALVLLHFNLVDLAVCIRVKSLDDAFGRLLEPLNAAITTFLRLPVGSTELETAQQAYLLSKMQALVQVWRGQALGISFSVPLAGTVLSLNIGLLISIVAATTVRCMTVVLCSTMPRFSRLTFVGRWLLGRRAQRPAGASPPVPGAAATPSRQVQQQRGGASTGQEKTSAAR